MQKKDLDNLDVTSLKEIHLRESQLLKEALLKGHTWAEVHELRKRVTQLSIMIHKKNNKDTDSNPEKNTQPDSGK